MSRSRAFLLAVLVAGALAPSAAAVPPPATPFVSLAIGAGDDFRPPARWPLAGQAGFGGLRGDIHAAARAHLEVFAYRHWSLVVMPSGYAVC